MSAHDKRKARRALEREIDERIDAQLCADRERHGAEMQALKERHAAELAAERAAYVELLNESVKLRGKVEGLEAVVDELKLEVSRAQADKAAVEHELLAETTARETAARRVSELAREVTALRSEDRDAAKLRRRLAAKTYRIDELKAEKRALEAQLREKRIEHPFAPLEGQA